jgi:hypothetical protein
VVFTRKEEAMSEAPIPYHEGEPAPGPEYARVEIVDDDGKSEGLFWVKASEVKTGGPLQHEDIDAIVPVLRWQWRHLGKYITWCRAFEDWERGFLQDQHPGSEVAIWTKATYAFLKFTHQERRANKAAIFQAIVGLLNGQEGMVKPKAVEKTLKRLMEEKPPACLIDAADFTEDGRLKSGPEYLR